MSQKDVEEQLPDETTLFQGGLILGISFIIWPLVALYYVIEPLLDNTIIDVKIRDEYLIKEGFDGVIVTSLAVSTLIVILPQAIIYEKIQEIEE